LFNTASIRLIFIEKMDSKPLSIATASIPEQPLVLHLVTSVIKKTVIPEVFYRE
jgi:hypothetical protein